MEDKPLAHIYVRHSTKQQSKGDSHRRQMIKAREWAERNGYKLQELYDSGRSAYTGDNLTVGQLGEFVDALRRRELGASPVLLVEAFDRLTRQEINKAQTTFLEIINRGATIVTLSNGMEYKAPLELGEIFTALGEMNGAHQYSSRLSDRVSSHIQARKQAGLMLHNSGSCPHWLAIIGPKRAGFVVLPDRAAVVLRVFEMAAAGEGPTGIARILRGDKTPKFPRTAGWSANMIQRLLLDRRVIGDFRRKGASEWVQAFFPAVVPMELFARVNECRVVRTVGAGKVQEYNLLRGLVHDEAGTKMIHRSSGYLNRRTGVNHYVAYLVGKGEAPLRVPYQPVENAVLWLLRNIGADMVASIQAKKNDDVGQRIADHEAAIISGNRILERVRRLLLGNTEPPETVMDDMRRIEIERGQHMRAIESLKLVQARRVEAVRIDGDLSDPTCRRAIRAKIVAAVLRIVVSRDYVDVYFSEDNAVRCSLDPEIGGVTPFVPPWVNNGPDNVRLTAPTAG